MLLSAGHGKTDKRQDETDCNQNKEKPMPYFDFACNHLAFTILTDSFGSDIGF